MRKTQKSNSEIEELNKWIDISCLWMKRCNIVESFLFILVYRFSAISVKSPADYLVNINRLILKFIWRGNRPRISTILKDKNKLEDWYYLTLRFTTKRMKKIDQWNRKKSTEIGPYKYSPLFLDKGAKVIQWNAKVVLSHIHKQKITIIIKTKTYTLHKN